MRPRILMGVWLDTSKAVIVRIEGDESALKILESGIETKERIEGEGKTFGRFGNQFIDDQKTRENRLREMESRYINTVLLAVKEADQLLIFGPAHAKNELENAVKNLPEPRPNIRAVEPADSMTDNQIAAYVREFFGKPLSATLL